MLLCEPSSGFHPMTTHTDHTVRTHWLPHPPLLNSPDRHEQRYLGLCMKLSKHIWLILTCLLLMHTQTSRQTHPAAAGVVLRT